MVATAIANDPTAHALLRAAHEVGYRFPDGFSGFAAGLIFVEDGATTTGRVRVRAPREIELDVDAEEAARAWLRQELGSMAGHRWPTAYEAGDGRWTQTLGPDDDHPLGRLIEIHDDPFGSSYRVRGGRIGQVNRRMGTTRFSITIQGHAVLGDGRTLPSAFKVSFWDEEGGRLTRADSYLDRYVRVENVYLPAARRVASATDAGMTTRELVLTGHELLPGDGATGPTDAAPRVHG